MLAVGVGLQRVPLLEELELGVFVEFHVKVQRLMIVVQGVSPVAADVLRPVRPLRLLKVVPYGHEQGIVVQPPGVLPEEGLIILVSAIAAALVGFAQQRQPAGVELVIIDVLRVAAEVRRVALLPRQHALPA